MKMQIQGVTCILVEQPPTIILPYTTLKIYVFSAKECNVYIQQVVTTGLKFAFIGHFNIHLWNDIICSNNS